MQTCRVKSEYSQVHDWVVYRLGEILGSVGHRVKIHKITPVTGKERGDLDIRDYVFLPSDFRSFFFLLQVNTRNILFPPRGVLGPP